MSDIEEDEQDEMKAMFDRAANYMQQIHTELSSQDLLEFYALYKQSTCGACNTPKPGMFSLQAKSKWSAWSNLGSLDQFEAMKQYVEKMTKMHPDWRGNGEQRRQWVCQSIHQTEVEDDIQEADKTAFDYVKERNMARLKGTLPGDLNTLDGSGLGLVHWAADRNTADILEYLLSVGADVNLQDSDGQTALHYASSCGHMDCLKVLLKFGADRSFVDNDGLSCLDVVFDENIAELLRS